MKKRRARFAPASRLGFLVNQSNEEARTECRCRQRAALFQGRLPLWILRKWCPRGREALCRVPRMGAREILCL